MLKILKIAFRVITILPGIIDCIRYNVKRIKEAEKEGNEKEVISE